MARPLRSAAAVAALIVALALPLAADAAIPQGAIVWTVNHGTKAIHILVKLELYPACDDAPRCRVTPEMASKMRDDILRVWNRGARYRCYELKFDVDITVGTNRFAVDDDRVGVRIDRSPTPIRSYVTGVGHDREQWQSDDPADKLVPNNDLLNPTTWAWPGRNAAAYNLYAHEYGHVLGLHDTYRDVEVNGKPGSVPIEGAPLDLMSTARNNISQETYDRLVKRSGVISDRDLQCDYRVDKLVSVSEGAVSASIHYTGVKCGDIGGEWTIDSQGSLTGYGGTAEIGGALVIDMDAETREGSANGTANFRARDPSHPNPVTHGNFSGSARLQDRPLQLVIEVTSGTGNGYIYGFLDTGFTKPGTLTLPVTVGSFCSTP